MTCAIAAEALVTRAAAVVATATTSFTEVDRRRIGADSSKVTFGTGLEPV
jgi:hypothetical protein